MEYFKQQLLLFNEDLNIVTGILARTTVPKDLEYPELAQDTGARYYIGELGSLVTVTIRPGR